MFWATSIFQVIMNFVSWLCFDETYAPVILRRRAMKLRKETGNEQYQTAEERRAHQFGHESALSTLYQALSRPIRLLMFHPIIQVTSLISAFNYGLLYIILSTFSSLWTGHYHIAVEISGLHYIACALGELAGSQVGGLLMDKLFKRMHDRRGPSSSGELHVPEYRIPLTFPGALIAPLGLFLYGWSGQYRLHWAIVDVGIFLVTFGGQIAGMPLTAYVMDAYQDHTSSATAANQFLRSLTAFLFPLFAPRMYEVMGYGWGTTAMAFAVLLFGFPAPLAIWFYGSKLRAKAQSSY